MGQNSPSAQIERGKSGLALLLGMENAQRMQEKFGRFIQVPLPRRGKQDRFGYKDGL